MKKITSLAQQVAKAQQVIESWPDARRSSLRLEGTDIFLSGVENAEGSKKTSEKRRRN